MLGSFAAVLTVQLGLSGVSTRVWTFPAYAVVVAVALGLAPRLRDSAARLPLLAAHVCALFLAFVYSNDMTRVSETTAKVLHLGIGGLWAFLALGLALVLGHTLRKGGAPLAWALAVCAAGCLIAYFSGERGGNGSWIEEVMRVFHWDRATAESAVLWLRKSLHFTFYGSVGWLGWRTVRVGGGSVGQGVAAGALVALASAMVDEGRQLASAGRTGSAWDVLLDMAGAATLLGLAAWRATRQSRR